MSQRQVCTVPIANSVPAATLRGALGPAAMPNAASSAASTVATERGLRANTKPSTAMRRAGQRHVSRGGGQREGGARLRREAKRQHWRRYSGSSARPHREQSPLGLRCRECAWRPIPPHARARLPWCTPRVGCRSCRGGAAGAAAAAAGGKIADSEGAPIEPPHPHKNLLPRLQGGAGCSEGWRAGARVDPTLPAISCPLQHATAV